MKLKIVKFIILISQLFFVLYATEFPLRFIHFEYPESIIIPSKIDFNDFAVICKIKYGYTGDWIGGCSREKFCNIFRMGNPYAKLAYLDDNDKELYIVDYPKTFDCLKTVFILGFGGSLDENFVFSEDEVYTAEIPILSWAFFQLKELKELIITKKITKIQIELQNVVVNWDYTCEEVNWKTKEEKNSIKSIKLEGKYEFQINKTYTINVKYEEQ